MTAWLAKPWRDLLDGMDAVLNGKARNLGMVMAGLLVGWWLYVPVHELSHAAACWLSGGEVTRLEIDSIYGGGLLAAVFPWVVAGSEYAGRLSGFDTKGSDLRYLLTDLGPFLWCPFGLALLLHSARGRRPFVWGAALPWSFAPFLSLPGDAYEMGSILLTRLPTFESFASVVRGDDAMAILPAARLAGATLAWSLAAAVGLAWALLWYGGSRTLARRWLDAAKAQPTG